MPKVLQHTYEGELNDDHVAHSVHDLTGKTALTSDVPVCPQHWQVQVGRGKGLTSDGLELQWGI